MGQRLIISENERSQIAKMYGLVNEQSSTLSSLSDSSTYKWNKLSQSTNVCIEFAELMGKKYCKKRQKVNWIYLDPITIEIKEFPQLSKLMNHFILNPNSMEDFEKTINEVGFDLTNPEKMYNDIFRFSQLIEDEVKNMNVELNKDKGNPNLKPEEYNFDNYKKVLSVIKDGLENLKSENPVDVQNMDDNLKDNNLKDDNLKDDNLKK